MTILDIRPMVRICYTRTSEISSLSPIVRQLSQGGDPFDTLLGILGYEDSPDPPVTAGFGPAEDVTTTLDFGPGVVNPGNSSRDLLVD